MVCTHCGLETQVINSRLQKRANTVWRRRRCLVCLKTVTTIEQIDYERTWTVSYLDGSERVFLRDKVFTSLYKSCQHRPQALEDAIGLTATVINQLRPAAQDGNIMTTATATICLETLQRFDKTAATLYRAYHEDVL